MTPQAAVAYLADIVSPRAEFTESDVYAALADVGVPQPVADRAYKFTQIAWGRVLLDGMGINFSPEYICFNGVGEIIESGSLAEQPYFTAASSSASRYTGTPGFERLALMAAEVNAVNELLNRGSKPENLTMATPALFMEPPTPAGIDRARQHLLRGLGKPKKPWWRFW